MAILEHEHVWKPDNEWVTIFGWEQPTIKKRCDEAGCTAVIVHDEWDNLEEILDVEGDTPRIRPYLDPEW